MIYKQDLNNQQPSPLQVIKYIIRSEYTDNGKSWMWVCKYKIYMWNDVSILKSTYCMCGKYKPIVFAKQLGENFQSITCNYTKQSI